MVIQFISVWREEGGRQGRKKEGSGEGEGNQSTSIRQQAMCLMSIFYSFDKTFNQKQLGEERFYLAYASGLCSHAIVNQSTKSEWELKAKTRNLEEETEAGSIEMRCLLDCSSTFLATCLRTVLAMVGWAF